MGAQGSAGAFLLQGLGLVGPFPRPGQSCSGAGQAQLSHLSGSKNTDRPPGMQGRGGSLGEHCSPAQWALEDRAWPGSPVQWALEDGGLAMSAWSWNLAA